MRPVFRLLPLPLCIAFSVSAQNREKTPEDYSLCPVDDAVPVFADAPTPVGKPEDRADQQTKVSGDSVDGISGQTLNLNGAVTLSRGDQFLHSDHLTYDQETERYIADGNVQYQDAGMRMLADKASGNQDKNQHLVENVRYQLTARRGNGGASTVQMDGTQGRLNDSTYSTCPPSARWWELRAPRIDLDSDKGFGTARNATIRVGKVPVLYFPYFKFPIDDRRQTGLLYPNIGLSGRNGFDWRQPIYFNLAPNYDTTLEPRFMSQRGLMISDEFRYLTRTGAGVLDVSFLPSDKLTDREHDEELGEFIANRYPLDNRRAQNRARLRFDARQNISSQWWASTSLNWVSDPRYNEDFSNNLYGLSSFSLVSSIGLYGRGRYWDAGIMADYRQLSDYTLSEAILPYNRLPRLYFNWERPYSNWLVAGINADATRFSHTDRSDLSFLAFGQPAPDADPTTPFTPLTGLETRPGGSRLDVKPYVSFPFQGASWFVTPTLAYRYTAYQLDRDLATSLAVRRAATAIATGAYPLPPNFPLPPNLAQFNPPPSLVASFYNDRPTRALPIGSLDAGLYFDRPALFRGERFLNTLEPRLFYLNSPYRDQSDLPLFDTGATTFSWGQLFRDNRFSGADRQTDANQLTLAMTTRLIRESDGREKLSASLGQILYFDDSRVNLGSDSTAIEQGKSAWVADANYAINDRWTIGTSYQWDPKAGAKDLASIRTRYLVGDKGIINLNYRYRRNLDYNSSVALSDGNDPDLLEQADLSFLYPVTPAWSLIGRYYYSIKDKQLLEGIAGVQWDSCCLAVRVVGRRYVRNRTGELNDAIQFEIELKGLGSAGADTESRLRRAILGYDRNDLYLVAPSTLSKSGNVDVNSSGLTP